MISKVHISATAAEFVGTFILALAVLTVSKSSLSLPFFISLTAGLVVAAMLLIFGRLSGAQLNPAITLGLLSIKRITALKALAYVAAQLAGGVIAYYLFAYFSGQRWHNTGQFETKLFVAEALGAFLFSLGWATVIYQKLESGKAAAIIGLSLVIALLVVSGAGNATLNPAVALSLRSWVWGSVLFGPILGAVAGFQAYKYFFIPELSHLSEHATPTSTVKRPSTQPQAAKKLR